MANGPHSSDVVQSYILQAMRSYGSQEDFENIIDISHTHDGQVEWSIGEVFDDEILKSFETEEFHDERLQTPDYGLKALDQIYGAIETTTEGNKRLEGLRALDIGWDFPTEGRTMRDWIHNYREAGLVDQEGELEVEEGRLENVQPSPEGEVFLQTDPRNYELDDVGVEDVGEVYRDLTTKKLGGEEPTGQKLEALFLYGAGMGHSQVSEATGMTYGTTKNFAYTMRDDHGILTDNHRLSPEGYEFANMVMDQLDLLEDATRERVQEEYGGWESVSPEDFSGNEYMARALD